MRIEDDILHAAKRFPGRTAIESGDRVLSYGQLDRLSASLVGGLAEAGIREGDPIWILMPNCPEFVVSVLAILRSGGVVVPVSDRLTDHELDQMAEKCPPVAIICRNHALKRSRSALRPEYAPFLVVAISSDAPVVHHIKRRDGEGAERAITTNRGRPGLVLFTSGSTGRPKAVLLTHENICVATRATAEAFGVKAGDRTVLCMQLCHSFALTKQLLTHLGMGATVVMAPNFFQPAALLDMIGKGNCTTLYAVPSMYVMLLDQIQRSGLQLPSLRMMVFSSAPMAKATQSGLMQAIPQAKLISYYGLSEASPISWMSSRRVAPPMGSVGRAFPGVEITIVGRDGRALPAGRVGEIWVRGPIVMAGYLGDPESTARCVRGAYLHTGDLGWMDEDGRLRLCGRKDERILRGAENVYPLEIEDVLCSHQAVLEAAVIGVADRILGSDLAAFVVLRPNRGIEAGELKAHCRKYLARSKIPCHIRIVDKLPKTANGKILRRALRDPVGRRTSRALSPALPVLEEM